MKSCCHIGNQYLLMLGKKDCYRYFGRAKTKKTMYKNTLLPILFVFITQSIFGQAFNMTLEGSWDNTSYEYNDCWGYTDDFGNEYAIMGSRTRVIFFDISIPSAPVLLAEFTGSFSGIPGANSIWRDIKTFDKYAYAVADQGSEGLMVFDMSDIHNGNITKVWQNNSVFTTAHNIFIDVPEGRLYIIGSNTQNNGLIVYDIQDNPSAPTMLASVPVSGGYIHDAYILNNIAYCSSGYDGLYVIDMTVPSNPVFQSFNESAADGYNHSNWPFDNGNKMIVAEEVPTGLRLALFDISSPNNISYLSSFRDPINTSGSGFPTYHNPYVVGDYAVISSYQDGITIMDLTNTSAPFRAAHYDTYSNSNYTGYEGCWGAYPYYPSGNIIGSDISTGLYVLSTSLTMTNTCTNGIKDDFEIDVDCGGFCNTCDCSSPRDIVFSDVAITSIQLDWTAVNTATGYRIRYREQGTSTWTNITSSTNMVTVSGLTQSATYEFQLRSDCGNRLTPYGTLVDYTIGNCPSRRQLSGTQGNGLYLSNNYIESSASIQIGSDVSYQTGDSIILNSSFMVDVNTDFLAEVNKPCGVALFTNPLNNAHHAQIIPALVNDAFTIVVNKDENILYLVCNSTSKEDYNIEIQDHKDKSLQRMKRSHKSKLLKIPLTSEMNKLRIQQGKETFVLSVQ